MTAQSLPVAPVARSAELARLARTIAILVALVAGAFLALTKEPAQVEATARASGSNAASLTVASGELVNQAVADSRVVRATGGYVPGVGVVITTELDSLPAADIDEWVGSLVADRTDLRAALAPDEQVIVLLDIAKPSRVTRLVAIDAGDVGSGGAIRPLEAPAISTAPIAPTFEPLDQGED